MAPDMDKERSSSTYGRIDAEMLWQDGDSTSKLPLAEQNEDCFVTDGSLECVYTTTTVIADSTHIEEQHQRHIRTDFSYVEQPIRAYLQPRSEASSTPDSDNNKRLACNNKSGVFLSSSTHNEPTNSIHEFCFIPDPSNKGSVWIQNNNQRKPRYLCSDNTGAVYVSETRLDDMEQWVIQQCPEQEDGFYLISVKSQRKMASFGNVVRTVNDSEAKSFEVVWTMDVTSGELCFLSTPVCDQRLRCDLTGSLSLSSNYMGWEAWRFSEAGNGLVRISPWAHTNHFLSCNKDGKICTTSKNRGQAELWSIQKAPRGESVSAEGVIIQSVKYPERYLSLDWKPNGLSRVCATNKMGNFCVWHMDSVHQSTYYLANTDCDDRRLVGTSTFSLDTSKLPIKRSCEEWQVLPTTEHGVVQLFSNLRHGYLSSDASGDTSLSPHESQDGSTKWVLRDGRDGTLLVSKVHKRLLVCNKNKNKHEIATSPIIMDGSNDIPKGSLWRLDPKIPRQITKEKMTAVGAAVAIGVATTVATPLVLGSAIGVVGVTEISVAGRVAMGSIRAAEAISTVSRIAVTSSSFIEQQSISSILAASGKNATKKVGKRDETKANDEPSSSTNSNRPFCEWRSW